MNAPARSPDTAERVAAFFDDPEVQERMAFIERGIAELRAEAAAAKTIPAPPPFTPTTREPLSRLLLEMVRDIDSAIDSDRTGETRMVRAHLDAARAELCKAVEALP